MLATLSLLLISNATTFAPKPTGNIQVAFIDSLLNSMTKGEGALKHTCYQVRHTSEPMTFIEQEQCRQAQKEVEFSKRQYPLALSFVRRYKRQELSSTTDQLRYLADSSKFIKDCKTEKNTRAAKTMRYWGTEEVGDWHYSNLKEMGADNYKSVLTACEPGSWAYTLQEEVESKISTITTEIANKNFVPSCVAVANRKKWSKAQQLENINTINDLYNKKNTLEILENQLGEDDDLISGIDSKLLYSKQKQIKNSSSFCQTAIALGEKAIADQEREKAKAIAAKREAERQYQRAKEAQRRAAAAEALRQQKIQNANEGVILD